MTAKKFNVTGVCIPEKHYMVDISGRIDNIAGNDIQKYEGQPFPYNMDDEMLNIAGIFGYIKEYEGKVMVSNRIFETRLYNLFVSGERIHSAIYTEGSKDRSQFVQNGRLDMKQVLDRFCVHFTELYGDSEKSFLEKSGRKFFLFYLKPIINRTKNYYVEARTRDEGRTDVIVDYLGGSMWWN